MHATRARTAQAAGDDRAIATDEIPAVTVTTLDQFLKACGSAGPWRLGIEGPDAPGIEYRTLHQPFVVVGRDADTDLRLDHPEVSRRHTYLQLVGGRLFCVDLQSRTGTRWQEGVKPMDWVRPDQAVGIGPYWIWFRDDLGRGEMAAQEDGVAPESRVAETRLEVSGPGASRTSWRIRRTIVLLGRSRPCWVRLPSRDVSRVHCSLVRTETGFWVVDLLSREGIAVNGQSVRWARLDPEDELEVGPYIVRLSLDAEVPRPSWSLARMSDIAEGRGPLALGPEKPRPLAVQVESTDPTLVPLLQELGQMQQQMAEQFQQALMMMFQLFSGMHQDQMALIRQELAEIRHLTEEQQALQAELARRPSPVNGTPPMRSPSPEPSAEPSETPTPAAASRPTVAGDRAGASSVPRSSPPPRPDRPASTQTAGAMAEKDLHAFLNQRLASIQEEQQSRWQKLLRTVMAGRDPAGAKS